MQFGPSALDANINVAASIDHIIIIGEGGTSQQWPRETGVGG